MASLRPILKRPAPGCPPSSPHLAVHFPPSPSLTTHTFAAHSAAAYDRSPIQVSPNSCALPERGCPGRTYTLDEPASPRARYHSSRGLHPRALKPRHTEHPMPPLIPDLESESDESDAFSSSPAHVLGLVLPYPVSPTALSFLPHPPSPPSTFDDDDDQHPIPKPRRRSERKHDPSRTPHRIPRALCTPTKKRVPALTRALQLPSFRVDDDGCLGGF